ncbi:helix-turn-helix transcriptional regulator [Dehalobacter sp. TeCB1]|uniref:helix-turn-helix domain-containing protein n=1 Tax=Dehalobacter sp. TeCB1 TaxID=1843715 RepID=UPI000A7BF961|nr:helix-turn-helix transcriptional regulator [Dehalobacter sp. TeCB1]
MLEKIQRLCELYKISLTKLERDLDFGRGSIYKWDKSSPSSDKVQKVADYFGVSTDYLLYGFERLLLNQLINYVRNNRTYEEFAKDTNIDSDEISKICMGLILEPPSLSTIEKIAANNPVDFLVSRTDLLQAAGYIDQSTAQTVNREQLKKYQAELEEKRLVQPLTPKEERDIAIDLERMMSDLESDQALAFQGEPLSEDDRELLRISLENSMKLAKQIAKKKFTPKKYR